MNREATAELHRSPAPSVRAFRSGLSAFQEASSFPLRLCLAIAFLGLSLRLVLAFGPTAKLDRWFVPDDTYYTLNIARSMARGLGPTTDGTHLTNGFQPLIAFFMVPVFALTEDPELPLRAAMVLLSIADAVVIFGVAKLAFRASRYWPQVAALSAGVFWALLPLAVAYALGGLETTLSLATVMGKVPPLFRTDTRCGASAQGSHGLHGSHRHHRGGRLVFRRCGVLQANDEPSFRAAPALDTRGFLRSAPLEAGVFR